MRAADWVAIRRDFQRVLALSDTSILAYYAVILAFLMSDRVDGASTTKKGFWETAPLKAPPRYAHACITAEARYTLLCSRLF